MSATSMFKMGLLSIIATTGLCGVSNGVAADADIRSHRKRSKVDAISLLAESNPAAHCTSMEGFMSPIRRVMPILVLAVVGLVGCAHEWRSVADVHPATVADMKAVLRDQWFGHIFWVRNVVLDNATNDRRALDFAEKAVVANARQIARTFTPFYGEAASEKFFTLLTSHYGAVKTYSESTVAENKRQQDEALADYASNTDKIAAFLSAANPYLPKDTVQGLFAVHGNHHVAQITQFQERDYAGEEATWQMMQQHVYVIADALTTALAKQFPAKFS